MQFLLCLCMSYSKTFEFSQECDYFHQDIKKITKFEFCHIFCPTNEVAIANSKEIAKTYGNTGVRIKNKLKGLSRVVSAFVVVS